VPCKAEKEFAFPCFDILMVCSLKAYSKRRIFYTKVCNCAQNEVLFLVGFPIQNLDETLAFADHKRSEARGRTDYLNPPYFYWLSPKSMRTCASGQSRSSLTD